MAPFTPRTPSADPLRVLHRYDPSLPNVLHDINFSIAAGEKIGIVGSTGSGKSTIALSFFRFVEPWAGSIVIDGIDISTIGLTDLRRRLTIIPQGSSRLFSISPIQHLTHAIFDDDSIYDCRSYDSLGNPSVSLGYIFRIY